MTSPTADEAVPGAEGTTPEPPAPPVVLTLAPVPGLQAIGGDAVGFCGPDGCYSAPDGTAAGLSATPAGLSATPAGLSWTPAGLSGVV
jgi:hypothetical protein